MGDGSIEFSVTIRGRRRANGRSSVRHTSNDSLHSLPGRVRTTHHDSRPFSEKFKLSSSPLNSALYSPPSPLSSHYHTRHRSVASVHRWTTPSLVANQQQAKRNSISD